jgi:hypothetical protein
MRWLTVFFIVIGLCLFPNPIRPAKAATANLFLDSPSISTIPVGQTIEIRLLTDPDGTTFVKWEIESAGQIVILDWVGRTSATGCNGGCTINLESETEFALGARDARVFGIASRGGTGIHSTGGPIELGILSVFATGPGFLRTSGIVGGAPTSPGSCPSEISPVDVAIAFGECNDGVDNDGDQLTDTDDLDCRDALGITEEPDMDGDGIPDANDPFPTDPDNDQAQCEVDLAASEDANAQLTTDLLASQVRVAELEIALDQCLNPPTQCSDGIDNDGDGKIDLEDRQCLSAEQDSEKKRNR